jgi:hypothetical protein
MNNMNVGSAHIYLFPGPGLITRIRWSCFCTFSVLLLLFDWNYAVFWAITATNLWLSTNLYHTINTINKSLKIRSAWVRWTAMVIETCWWFSPCSLFSPSISLKRSCFCTFSVLLLLFDWNYAVFWAITATNLWLSLAITYNAIRFIVLVKCVLRLDRLVEICGGYSSKDRVISVKQQQ